MKKSLLTIFLILSSIFVFAQNELMVQNDEKGLFVYHTVVPKENFYSIGRLYNISPKEIASFNSLDMTKGLIIGEIVKIPLVANNFNQNTATGKPVYYTVGENEGLYRVSTKNKKVLMANLRKWNRLTNDKLTPGQKLIIGYLNSPEANNITVSNANNIKPFKEVKEPPITDEPKKDISFQKQETVKPKNEDVIKPKMEDSAPVQEKQERKNVTTQTAPRQTTNGGGDGGYFKSQFEQQIKAQPTKADITASGGIFKTTSGYQDAKYYALIDNVDPGTIIHIINPANNKSVYAKVLGSMSGVRQNQGYDLRVSSAAASVLAVSDTEKFYVRVVY